MFHRSTLVLLTALLTFSGCAGVSEMILPKSQADRDQAQWEADAKADHDKCVLTLDALEKKLEDGKAAFYAKTVTSEDEVSATYKEIKAFTQGTLGSIPSECRKTNNAKEGTPLFDIYETYRTPILARQKALDAGVREESPKLRLDLVKKAVAAGAPVAARGIFWTMYQDEAPTEREEYVAIARELGTQFDKVLLDRYTKNGGYAHLGEGKSTQGCMYSAKPFPKKLGKVAPIFNSHIEGNVVHVLCRLPQPAKSYALGSDPQLTLQLISENVAGTVFVAEHFELGTPEKLGDAMMVRGKFDLPPSNGSFPKYVRFWFDTRVVVGYSVPTIGGGLERKTKVPAQSSFSWKK